MGTSRGNSYLRGKPGRSAQLHAFPAPRWARGCTPPQRCGCFPFWHSASWETLDEVPRGGQPSIWAPQQHLARRHLACPALAFGLPREALDYGTPGQIGLQPESLPPKCRTAVDLLNLIAVFTAGIDSKLDNLNKLADLVHSACCCSPTIESLTSPPSFLNTTKLEIKKLMDGPDNGTKWISLGPANQCCL
ncbi:hypothetical protein NDU88_009230 [Pleurodeles waltl]|uniref:Uncharacterized protein n=1 Tax=Pleurodeles waltl TaxID=8319 RepID=A0AAV7RVI9_PLEWA|nr:hypothetical protein NDU88_009230 [Pleurodeles waltl]